MENLEKNTSFENNLISVAGLISKELISNNLIPNPVIKSYTDLLNDLFWIIDLSGKYTYANKTTCEILFNSLNYNQIINKTDYFLANNNNEEKFQDLTSNQIINLKKNSNLFGKKIEFQITYLPLTDQNNKIFAYMGYAINALERCYEKPLKQFEKVWEKSFDSMRLLNEDGTVLSVNKAFCNLVEKTENELIGTYYNYIYSDEEYNPKLDFNINNVRPFFEREVILWNYKHVWFEITSTIIEYEDGTKSVLSIFKDITDKKLTNKKLKEVEQRYKETADLLPQIICEVDLFGKILYCNQQTFRCFPISQKDIDNGYFLCNLIAEEDRERIKTNLFKKLDKIGFFNEEYLGISKNGGKLPILVFATAIIKDEKTTGLRCVIIDISERKKNEEALRKSESLYKNIVTTSPDAIVLVDLNVNIIFANDRTAQLFGFELGFDMVGINGFSFVAAESSSLINQKYFLLLKLGTIETIEIKFNKKNNTSFWSEFRAKLICDSNGNPQNILIIITDITLKKESEEEAKLNELRMETLLKITQMEDTPINNISDYVLLESVKQTKSEGAFIAYLNENEQLLSVKTLANNTITENTFDKSNYKSSISSSLWLKPLLVRSPFMLNDYTSAYLADEKLPASQTLIIRYLGVPLFSGNKIIAVAGIINKKSDYTELDIKQLVLLVTSLFNTLEHRKKEEKIKTLSRAIEQNPSIIVITNPDGIIQYTNPKFTEITGYPASEVLGLNPRILKSGQTPAEKYEQLWSTITAGHEWNGELLNKKKNGSYYWEQILISPIKNDTGEITNYVAIKQDVSEKKIFEKQLIEAKEKAEKSDKVKSEFLAQMSHEIRTPINAILSFSSLLRDELEHLLDEDLRSSFSIMARAGVRIIRTIDLILNMSELQTGTYDFNVKEIDLKEDILHSLMLEHTMMARDKGLVLSLSSYTDNTYVFADEYSVMQIFTNLINNAIKFTDNGMVEVVISSNEPGNTIIDVIDTGIGISEDYIPFLFSPFSQEEQGYTRRFEGNGLGLALVKKYCDLNDATIFVESEKGKGSKFRVFFSNKNNCII
ncbi:MAG: PAS domain S-box protein [bacterium]